VRSEPAPSGLITTVTSDSRSGVERHAGHYLTVNAAYVVLVAVGSTHDDLEAAAHARIRVGTQGLDLFRPELAL
jgi:hypothetical protein